MKTSTQISQLLSEKENRMLKEMYIENLQEEAWEEFQRLLIPLLENPDIGVLDYVAEYIYRLGADCPEPDMKRLMDAARKLYLLDCEMMQEEPKLPIIT